MKKRAITCRRTDSLKFAVDIMNRNEISRLIVTDEDGRPEGLISTNTFLNHSDYFSKEITDSRDYLVPVGKSRKPIVADLVGDKILIISEEEDLVTAASIMIKNKISGIPVVNSQKDLVGVISKFDIIRAFIAAGLHEELKSEYRNVY